MRILITDDELTSRKILQKLLGPLGDCFLAGDGSEALKLFIQGHNSGQPFDLVMLDLHMEELGGIETLDAMRSYEEQLGINGLSRVKVIMVTVSDESDKIMNAFRTGCEGYIVKPVDSTKLQNALKIIGI